jgi:small subunit ribosomal protein S11
MSRSLISRFAAHAHFKAYSATTPISFLRSISSTPARWADPPKKQPLRPADALMEGLYGPSRSSKGQTHSMAEISKALGGSGTPAGVNTAALLDPTQSVAAPEDALEPYHFHIYSQRHNTHITCTRPNREPIISMSCGNIGFKKSRRGTFDAAYSLAKYVLERLIHTGWPPKMNKLEVVLRGFGQGREAAVKVLMSPEGKVLRDKIIRVADNTKIKFAGTRAKKRRRL